MKGSALQSRHERPQASPQVDFTWGLKIPMRDGVNLNATLYRPRGENRTPAIFTLTPYIADSYHERAWYFARSGYTFALVDCRGRGNSQGAFNPFFQEADDGHDIVAWLVGQPWCDGSVAMWGGSYAGFNQWLTLREAPPGLKTIAPVAAAHAGVDFPFLKNIFDSYLIQWLTLTSGVTGNAALFAESQFWIDKFSELYQDHLPFHELERIVGNTTTVFQDWLAYPEPGPYWDRATLTSQDYDRIEIPILTITGHYDDDQAGALEFYRRHIASNSPAKQNHYLVIGPWDHAGTRTPKREVGGVQFGEASLLDLNKLHKDWYDWRMQSGERPEFLKSRLAYYLMGAETWKYASGLESIPVHIREMYLSSDGNTGDALHSGWLELHPPENSPPDRFIYDPLDTRPAEFERCAIEKYLTDQSGDLNLYGNGLVYHSAPFDSDTELTGFFKLVVWIALDVPDTDFRVTVSEILQDGSLIRLSQDQLRARYRVSLRKPELVVSGDVNKYTFDGFTFMSRLVAKGSRLRLRIECPNTIYLQKNYNSGGVVAQESGSDARTARITIYHDVDHPSCLYVPVNDL